MKLCRSLYVLKWYTHGTPKMMSFHTYPPPNQISPHDVLDQGNQFFQFVGVEVTSILQCLDVFFFAPFWVAVFCWRRRWNGLFKRMRFHEGETNMIRWWHWCGWFNSKWMGTAKHIISGFAVTVERTQPQQIWKWEPDGTWRSIFLQGDSTLLKLNENDQLCHHIYFFLHIESGVFHTETPSTLPFFSSWAQVTWTSCSTRSLASFTSNLSMWKKKSRTGLH